MCLLYYSTVPGTYHGSTKKQDSSLGEDIAIRRFVLLHGVLLPACARIVRTRAPWTGKVVYATAVLAGATRAH